MKLAEALILRSDLQKKVASLRSRIIRNAKVQEGEKPGESPNELIVELNSTIKELEDLINKINRTNSRTVVEGSIVISDLISKREFLGKQNQIFRELTDAATIKFDRYSKSEVKFYSTVNVSEIQKEIDRISKEYRLTDTKLQGLNWTIDLME